MAYSYRQALQSKAMKYEDLINVAVDTGTDGIDMTVYWLPSTEADYLRSLRRLDRGQPARAALHNAYR